MKRTVKLSIAFAAMAVALGCASPAPAGSGGSVEAATKQPEARPPTGGGEMQKIELTSSAFEPGGEIPAAHTCQGDDLSVPLAWSGVPAGAKSLALIVDDPDAPDPQA
ncbi:MAG TPA: hypothetical protein VM285_06195, partial [Polyangia bacterium]|nr:hypothetical protein [Polyangia bacterium]